jgi:hypothetical protein
MTRHGGESFAAQPLTERDHGPVVHPREAAELAEPAAGRGRSLNSADGAEQMAAFRGSVREQESEVGLPCLWRRPGFEGFIHQRPQRRGVN